VSSLIAQGTEFPLRKPPGFHWDIFLLGLTTFIAGLLGIPFPNGLIPQAPFHTNSLCVTRQVTDPDETNKGKTTRVVDHVVEQRVSNLAQGLLTLGTMTGPLLVVLHHIPQGVLAGLFFVMGTQALVGNGITQKMLFLARDQTLTSASDPLVRLERKSAVWIFVSIELLGFAATFAITQTIAAIGFPVFILLLIPVRTFLMPKWFRPEELRALDAPTAGPFVMESVGGAYGHDPNGTGDGNGGGNGDGAQDVGTVSSGQPSCTSRADSPIDDTLERGESYEMRSQSHSHGQMQRPEVGMRRRSGSSAGRGKDVNG
jgi:boron transporter